MEPDQMLDKSTQHQQKLLLLNRVLEITQTPKQIQHANEQQEKGPLVNKQKGKKGKEDPTKPSEKPWTVGCSPVCKMISSPQPITSRTEDERKGPKQEAANMHKEEATFNPTDNEFPNK